MTRACLTLLGLVAAAGCARDPAPAPAPAPTEDSGPAGPVYSAAIADLLKALADRCELTRVAGAETRQCRGRQAQMTIELDRARRIRMLDIAILAANSIEAWQLFQNVLPGIVGWQVTGTARALLRGDSVKPVNDGVRVTASRTGDRYRVQLTWVGAGA